MLGIIFSLIFYLVFTISKVVISENFKMYYCVFNIGAIFEMFSFKFKFFTFA